MVTLQSQAWYDKTLSLEDTWKRSLTLGFPSLDFVIHRQRTTTRDSSSAFDRINDGKKIVLPFPSRGYLSACEFLKPSNGSFQLMATGPIMVELTSKVP